MANGSTEVDRTIDYVAFVGAKEPLVDSTQFPQLLRRFPASDYKDFRFPNDMVFFCQPEGCATISRRHLLRETNTFVFTLTEKDSNIVRYGICCNFFRPTRLNTSHYARKSSDKVISHCRSLTSICILSRLPFFTFFRECLLVFRQSLEGCSDKGSSRTRTASHTGGLTTSHEEEIAERWSEFLNPNGESTSVLSRLQELESWIKALLDVPTPYPGGKRIEVELMPAGSPHQVPLTLCLPDAKRLAFIDFPIHLPFELLGVDACMRLLSYVMLEHKVVLISRDYNALSISVLAIVSLLYPMEYLYPVIPLLPTSLQQGETLLLAPTPYIIGLPSTFLKCRPSFRVPDDVIVVDLDCSSITVPELLLGLPSLPEGDLNIVCEQIKTCLDCVSPFPHIKTQPTRRTISTSSGHNASSSTAAGSDFAAGSIYGNDSGSIDVAIRVAMVRFLFSSNLCSGIERYTRVLRLFSKPVAAFQSAYFVSARHERSEFVCRLAETQSLQYLCQWLINPTNYAFLYILQGVSDPRLIGDKPRWYCNELDSTLYCVHRNMSPGMDSSYCSTGSASPSSFRITNNAEDSTASRSSDSEDSFIGYKMNPVSSDLGTSELASVNQYATPSIYQKCSLPSPGIAMDAASSVFFSPPHRQSTGTSGCLDQSDLSGGDTESVDSCKLKEDFTPSECMSQAFVRLEKIHTNYPAVVTATAPPSSVAGAVKSNGHAEDVKFLKEVTASVMGGSGVFFLYRNRVRKLMKMESMRLAVLSEVYRPVVENKDPFVPDVWVPQDVYDGLRQLASMILEGYKNNQIDPSGVNWASLFVTMEILHTHYTGVKIDVKQDAVNSKDIRSMYTASRKDSSKGISSSDASEYLMEVPVDVSKQCSFIRLVSESPSPSEASSPRTTVMSNSAVDQSKLDSDASELNPSCFVCKSRSSGLHRYRGRTLVQTLQVHKNLDRSFLFEDLAQTEYTFLRDMSVWEIAFLDAVSVERELVHAGVSSVEAIARYNSLGLLSQRYLEEGEDYLLLVFLHNLIAFMVAVSVDVSKLKKLVGRLLARCYVGLQGSSKINQLLDSLPLLHGNDIDLYQPVSRCQQRQGFTVHLGRTSDHTQIGFLEVCPECLILKTSTGTLLCKWWYEDVLNLSCSPRRKLITVWVNESGQTEMFTFWTKRCRAVYMAVRDCLADLSRRLHKQRGKLSLGVVYPVVYLRTQEKGSLQIKLNAVRVVLESETLIINLDTISQCTTEGSVLSFEAISPVDQEKKLHQFYTTRSSDICYTMLCLFSYLSVASGEPSRKKLVNQLQS